MNAFKIWEGGLGIWGAVALGALGASIGCRRRGACRSCASPAPPRASPWPRRSDASATTSTTSCTAPAPTCRGACRSTSGTRRRATRHFAGGGRRGRRPRLLPADLPLRVHLVPDRGRGPRPGRAAVRPAQRTGVRSLSDALHPRTGGHRDVAHRHGKPHSGTPARRWTSVVVFLGALYGFWRAGRNVLQEVQARRRTTRRAQTSTSWNQPSHLAGFRRHGLFCSDHAGQCRPPRLPEVFSRDLQDGAARGYLFLLRPAGRPGPLPVGARARRLRGRARGHDARGVPGTTSSTMP